MYTVAGTVYDDTGAPVAGRIVRAYRRDTGALVGIAETSDGTGGAYDPDWLQVVSLLHFDGADESTDFVDETGKVWTAAGGAKISVAQSAFGGSSVAVDGDGDYLTAGPSADLSFGGGDFTVEGFFYPSIAQTGNRFLLDFRVSGGASFMLWCSQSGATNRLGFSSEVGTGFVSGGAWTLSAWNHFAITRQDGTIRCFVAGAVAFTTIDARAYASPQGVHVGSSATASQGAVGFVDELRITKGLARYTEPFTPPSAPFPNTSSALPVGQYEILTEISSELQLVFLDDDAGTLYNDIIHRVIPA